MFNNFYSASSEDKKPEYDKIIKVVVLGESGVRKSNIIIRYNGGKFDSNSLSNNSSTFVQKYYTFGKKFIELMFGIRLGKKNIIL